MWGKVFVKTSSIGFTLGIFVHVPTSAILGAVQGHAKAFETVQEMSKSWRFESRCSSGAKTDKFIVIKSCSRQNRMQTPLLKFPNLESSSNLRVENWHYPAKYLTFNIRKRRPFTSSIPRRLQLIRSRRLMLSLAAFFWSLRGAWSPCSLYLFFGDHHLGRQCRWGEGGQRSWIVVLFGGQLGETC